MATQFESAKTTAKKVARRTLWVILIASILTLLGYYFWRVYPKSEGTRTGVLFKVSKKGYAFKTYEGQLHLGGSAMMTPQSVWDFSAKDDAVYQQLQQFEGKSVKCHYKELVDAFPWQGDTDYIVYQVELIQ